MKLIVDTSILIDHLRGGTVWKQFLGSVETDAELFLPTVIIFELFSGKSTSDSSVVQKINKLLSFFQKIDLNEKIAKRAGILYRDMNKTIEVPDYIIAATALELGGTVVTLNTKHFKNIPHLDIYTL